MHFIHNKSIHIYVYNIYFYSCWKCLLGCKVHISSTKNIIALITAASEKPSRYLWSRFAQNNDIQGDGRIFYLECERHMWMDGWMRTVVFICFQFVLFLLLLQHSLVWTYPHICSACSVAVNILHSALQSLHLAWHHQIAMKKHSMTNCIWSRESVWDWRSVVHLCWKLELFFFHVFFFSTLLRATKNIK